ncbi:MOSC domain-containing protein [Gilvimarinus sp. SDUM040013]|uniref:MOSC domain-containing protein n=1 Tax=Gilvimarinus gilvus TaxID=3058038 RepID=A0ABU4S291_9GAMM|nr:MOSC domain-containing protein [Gilvimarinus sp. SDUM040013]MDO3385448.1 MOSC domain-containing protein [Gilvimarinus sp. SDUM040013]MDX6851135.1 MOSC domain-containing protein [Gilvimarinus sp. SDUM040013]
MHLLSINSAVATELEIGNKTVTSGIFKEPLSGDVQISEFGVEGDTIVDTNVHGGEDQALYLYSAADYTWWSKQLGGQLSPGTFGENLTISDFHAGELRIGDQLKIGDAVLLEITAPRVPCVKFAAKMGDPKFVKQFVAAQRPGAYARVIRAGTISAGAPIEWRPTEQDYASVKEVFVQWHQKAWHPDAVKRALHSPISKIARGIIEKRTGVSS